MQHADLIKLPPRTDPELLILEIYKILKPRSVLDHLKKPERRSQSENMVLQFQEALNFNVALPELLIAFIWGPVTGFKET